MRQRNNNRRTSKPPIVLGCFDADLAVRRKFFNGTVVVCNMAVDGPPDVPTGGPTTLRFGDVAVDLSGVLGWLTPLAENGGWMFYVHHHDNIAVELAQLERYNAAAFRRALRKFCTRPAAEGGTNQLGVVGQDRAWLLVVVNDNQGGFRIDFHGPANECQCLESHLALE